MNQTQPTRATTAQPAAPARRGLAPVCRCGQDLDVCTGSHCPRCGTTLIPGTTMGLAA